MAQQMQMLEMQKLQAEIAKLQAEAQSIPAEGMLDMAKAQTEQVKAAHLGSQKDMLDLNFLEEKQGVNHQRDMQKQGAQAQANMIMKEREAQLKDRNTLLSALAKPQPRTPSANR
jgi:hydroxylamine reductase (hybrid-cluster protein)